MTLYLNTLVEWIANVPAKDLTDQDLTKIQAKTSLTQTLLIASGVYSTVNPSSITPPGSVSINQDIGQLILNWGLVSGATSYNIYYSYTSGGPYLPLPGGNGITGSTFTDQNASTTQATYYVITSVASGHESSYSSQVTSIAL